MRAMFTRTIAKAQTLARAARLAAMVKAETTNDFAEATVTPPAGKAAAAAPAQSSGRANSPQAAERTATRTPIPTPTADITQFPGRASRRRPAIPVRGTVRRVQIVAHSWYRE